MQYNERGAGRGGGGALSKGGARERRGRGGDRGGDGGLGVEQRPNFLWFSSPTLLLGRSLAGHHETTIPTLLRKEKASAYTVNIA